MKQNDIILQLNQNHFSFIDFIFSLDEIQFVQSKPNRWSAGQQLEHIYLSIYPLTRALELPPFILRLLFGKANRPSRRYDVVVEKYKDKLANGAKATQKYTPVVVAHHKKEVLIKNLQRSLYKLSSLIKKFKEEELDSLVLPHPLLGKLTIREILYFTAYHVKHHEDDLRKTLGIYTA
jgi:hypothetical protein